jgi:ABC-type multidrug transport system ATPase subunit
MDEPSMGLDPASRMNLWNVVKKAKKDHAIILTSECPLGYRTVSSTVLCLPRFCFFHTAEAE